MGLDVLGLVTKCLELLDRKFGTTTYFYELIQIQAFENGFWKS